MATKASIITCTEAKKNPTKKAPKRAKAAAKKRAPKRTAKKTPKRGVKKSTKGPKATLTSRAKKSTKLASSLRQLKAAWVKQYNLKLPDSDSARKTMARRPSLVAGPMKSAMDAGASEAQINKVMDDALKLARQSEKRRPKRAKKNPVEEKKTLTQRAGAATKRAAKKAAKATGDAAKSAALRAGAATKRVAKKAAERAAVESRKAAIYSGEKLAAGGRRVAKKGKGVAKSAWAGAVKGWKENPTGLLEEGTKYMIERRMGNVHVGTSDEEVKKIAAKWLKSGVDPKFVKAVVAYALKCHRKNQKFYGEVMGGRLGAKRRVKSVKKNPATKKTRKGSTDRWVKAWFPPSPTRRDEILEEIKRLEKEGGPRLYENAGGFAEGLRRGSIRSQIDSLKKELDKVKKNPVRSSEGYIYRIAYETWDEEALEAGETDDRGWEEEESSVYETLDELLRSVSMSANWLEWSDSHPSAGSWIVSQDDQDFRTGDRTIKSLFISRTDGRDLTTAQLKYIDKVLGLRGTFGRKSNPTLPKLFKPIASNPSQDQLHVAQKGGKWYAMLEQNWIPIPESEAKSRLASGEAVKVPWSHKAMKHHEKPDYIDSRRLGLALQNWHHGQGDPIYAAGSSLYAGKSVSVDVLEDALNRIRALKSSPTAKHDKAGHKELVEIEKQLAYMVGGKKSVDSIFREAKAEGAKHNPSMKPMTKAQLWGKSRLQLIYEIDSLIDILGEAANAKGIMVGVLGSKFYREPPRGVATHEVTIVELRTILSQLRQKAHLAQGAKGNPAKKSEKPFLAWTNAAPAYDYWYVKDTGTSVKGFRLVEVSDKERWEQFQVPRYQSGWHVAFLANDTVQLKNFGLPAKASKGSKRNPTRKPTRKQIHDQILLAGVRNLKSIKPSKVEIQSIYLNKLGAKASAAVPTWKLADTQLSQWKGKVRFVVTYRDGETYTGTYESKGGKESLARHIRQVLDAVAKAPASKISANDKAKWKLFRMSYDTGCNSCK